MIIKRSMQAFVLNHATITISQSAQMQSGGMQRVMMRSRIV